MPHPRPYRLIVQGRRVFTSSAALLVVLLALVGQRCQGATVRPHPDCTGPCGEDRTCPSPECRSEWDSCPPGSIQVGDPTPATDEGGECYDTGCFLGGCNEGFKQVSSKPCLLHGCAIGVCFEERCCALRPSVQCCRPLSCNITYADCEVPQQAFLADTSRSAVEGAALRHGHRARFPFYTSHQMSPGGSCGDVLVNGGCTCDDGRTVPGCRADDSSSWFLWVDGPQDTANVTANVTAGLLPANLSLTCTVLPPPPVIPEPPPAAPLPQPAVDATAQGVTSPPPPKAAEGAGGGGRPRSAESRAGGGAGWLVAVVVIGCLALAGVTAGIVLWCCGLLPDLHNLRIRSLTTYEPVFTGQSYTPGMGGGRRHSSSRSAGGGGGGAPYIVEDIPWNHFCTAVTEAARRIMYGKRYVEESASAAAAAERYRTLNALGRRRSDAVAAGDDYGQPAWSAAGKQTRGSLLLSTYPSGRGKAHEDDLDVDEVFTLEDLGATSSDTAGGGAWRPVGPLPMSRFGSAAAAGGGGSSSSGAGGGGPQLPQSLRASSGAGVLPPAGPWWPAAAGGGGATAGAAAAAELAGAPASGTSAAAAAVAAPSAGGQQQRQQQQQQQHRARLNQFGGRGADADGGAAAAAGNVIHTRPLPLGDGDGDGDSGGEYEPPPDVDAPLRWLPSPQVTGQGPGGR